MGNKPRAEIMFTRTSEFLYYIVNNLDKEYNYIRYTLTSNDTKALLADGEVRYMEDVKESESGMFYINIYNAKKEVASKLSIPLKINTGINDSDIELSKNGCYNTKSILKMFSKLELVGGITYKIDIFNDRAYYRTLKRSIQEVPYNTLTTNIHNMLNMGFNSLKISIEFEDYCYSFITEVTCIHTLNQICCSTKLYLEDGKEYLKPTATFYEENDIYAFIMDIVQLIKNTLVTLHDSVHIQRKDTFRIEYWRSVYA